MEWYEIKDIQEVITPSLIVYPNNVKHNIQTMLEMVGGDPGRLRPHVKTYKMKEIVALQRKAGIEHFKCATVAEAEMLGSAGVEDVLLAYQPVGPNISRLIELIAAFPKTRFSALVDNDYSLGQISSRAVAAKNDIGLFIDLDIGMHRTGIGLKEAFALGIAVHEAPGVALQGLHAYDGHIRGSELADRQLESDQVFSQVYDLRKRLNEITGLNLEIIAGGSPTFPVHALRKDVVCSPGTVLLWDSGYGSMFPDMKFKFAGLVASRIISKPGSRYICTDLGHKAVAADKPLPRVEFLNLPDGQVVSQSEEHLLIDVEDNSDFEIGSVLYGVPSHICPTCALHMEAIVVEENEVIDIWKVVSRNRKVTY